jgi:ligand-binding sensor domain-containing protein
MSWPTYTEYSGFKATTVLYVAGTLYIGHDRGLSISHNAGVSFLNTTTSQGLGSNDVYGVAVDAAGVIYAATDGGLNCLVQ